MFLQGTVGWEHLPLSQNFLAESINTSMLNTRGELAFLKEMSVTEDKMDFLIVPQTQF